MKSKEEALLEELNLSDTTKRIYEATMKIPKGCVATYSQIARLAGNEKMCRVVGNVLHNNPLPGIIPCHRVVNSKGKPALEFAFGGDIAQISLLESEGVLVINGRVDLEKYQIKKI